MKRNCTLGLSFLPFNKWKSASDNIDHKSFDIQYFRVNPPTYFLPYIKPAVSEKFCQKTNNVLA